MAGATVFALALVSLGVSWATGRAPRARRIVVLHVVTAGALVALVAPFVLTQLLAIVADYNREGAGANFTMTMSLALAPLAMVLGPADRADLRRPVRLDCAGAPACGRIARARRTRRGAAVSLTPDQRAHIRSRFEIDLSSGSSASRAAPPSARRARVTERSNKISR